MKKDSAARYAVDLLQVDPQEKGKEPYIKPSSLAKGCLLYIAFELREEPKPSIEARIGRILSVGTDSHRRLQRGLARACLGQEVFFEVPEYRLHGLCDGILYIRPEMAPSEAASGFWALEFKTTAAGEFDKLKSAGIPKEEHIRQAQIYLWGLGVYYHQSLLLKRAIIYYENRDTLEHLAFEVLPDPQAMDALLARVKAMLDGLEQDRLPEDYLPPDHWAHRYCPYLEVCTPGQQALEWQAKQPKSLPDEVLAEIIAKKGAEKMSARKTGPRSLAELTKELDWE